ncbi:hypothetical protein BLGI_392 [Brevibacillus laterosporus GI-9]|nr:hypothetical protein BLGI_392 [Brevibacillus laterosporus GI-9]
MRIISYPQPSYYYYVSVWQQLTCKTTYLTECCESPATCFSHPFPNLNRITPQTITSTPINCLKVKGTLSSPNQPSESHNKANPSCDVTTIEMAYVGPSSLIPCTRQITTPTPIKPLNQYQVFIFCNVNMCFPSKMKPIVSEATKPIPNTNVVVVQEPTCSFTLPLKIFCKPTSEPAIKANTIPRIIAFSPFTDVIPA